MATYVPDGWSREGYIEGSRPSDTGERLWESLEFTYRPATRMEVVRLDSKIDIALRSDTEESAIRAEMLACEFVAARIEDWSLKSAGMHPVKVSADGCARMNANLFKRLYEIVRGSSLSDAKPGSNEKSKSDEELLGNSQAASGSV